MGEEIERMALAGRPNQWTGEGPVWCLVGTMRADRAGSPAASGPSNGNKYFASGARLYFRHCVGDRNGNVDEPVIEVVGRHRKTHRYLRFIMRADWVENWRVDLVYGPAVIRLLMPEWDGSKESKAVAQEYLEGLFSDTQAVAQRPQTE